MKKILTSVLLFSTVALTAAFAQNPGCDGIRYKNNVFTGVKKTTVQYATAVNQANVSLELMMDVYEPEGDIIAKRPVVVLAHGGSFMTGNKTDMKRWCELLAKKGYVAASIQYRLFPLFILGLPDSTEIFDTAVRAVGDMKCAVRFLREDAATAGVFRADPDNIFVGGYSAGSVIALHAGFLDSNDVVPSFIQTILDANGGVNGNTGSTLNQTYSSSIKAVVNMSGGLYRSFWVDAGNVPVTSIHGDNDGTVPYTSGLAANIAYLEGSSLVRQEANNAGLLNDLVTVPGGGHTDIYDPAKLQFAPFVDSFWVNATTLLEYLSCQVEVTAVDDLYEKAGDWGIDPNPAVSGQVCTIRFPESVQRAGITLTDLSGKVVAQASNLQPSETIRWPAAPAGIYSAQFVDMDNADRVFRAKKVVLIR
ncbi:MAG: carboxylesterase family protein [Lewinellaceae bacterium]|nr:carboxylesterase family protein [Lewinellaceae bacterium]